MREIVSEIRKIANKIRIDEKNRKLLAETIKNLKINGLTNTIEPFNINNLKIAAIDGGLIKKSVHGFDFMLIRAASVLFYYKNNKINSVKYFPEKNLIPTPIISETISDIDWIQFSSIMREKTEIKNAINCINHLKPDILLLDGSIIPYYLDKPSKSSQIYKDYIELVNLYKKLYEKALSRNIILAGIVEDSKATVFCEFIKENILNKIDNKNVQIFRKLLNKTRDTNLLSLLLKHKEMSRVLKYSSKKIISEDLNQYAENIFLFYIKTAKFDRPIRVEFLNKENAEKLGKILLSISGQHFEYGIPTPLIEADNIAKLSERDFENFYSKLLSYTGNLSCLKKLRREQRPF